MGSIASRSGTVHTRTSSGRQSLAGPTRQGPGSRPPTNPQDDKEDALHEVSPRSNAGIVSPPPRGPVASSLNSLEQPPRSSSGPAGQAAPRKGQVPPQSSRPVGTTAAGREIEDLKSKLKVAEKRVTEDRDKVKQLETVQAERDRLKIIIEKLQPKCRSYQEENADLRKQLKDAESSFESIETLQAEHDSILELATLDREMAEEEAEHYKIELEALQIKAEEFELELEILKAENAEFTEGMSSEERADTGWLQKERENERLREALYRLRDLTQVRDEKQRGEISSLEDDLKEQALLQERHSEKVEQLKQSDNVIEELRSQLDTALGAEDMLEDLTDRNMSLTERVDELKAVVEDLEDLKELSEELEANHIQFEKEMQEELDLKDVASSEQLKQNRQQQEAMDDMEYTLSKFRELVTTLQGDLQDMRASHAVTEGESEKLNDRSRAMMDLNMKLQISAEKAQAKTIDLELRRLEALEAEKHLEIVQVFMPDTYKEDKDSVLALLRFRRLTFKATLLHGFFKDRVNGQPHHRHEDDVFAACDAIDKLVWVSAMCNRFVDDISHCSVEHFSDYQNVQLELEPVERALNVWIDAMRRDDLKQKQCAEELQRSVALMSHLAEVYISDDLANFAGEVHMTALVVQSNLDSAAVVFGTMGGMIQRALSSESEDEELTEQFVKRCESVISKTRNVKVFASKTVKALEDLKTRSLALPMESREAVEQCGGLARALADLSRQIANTVHSQLNADESRSEPFKFSEIQEVMQRAVLDAGLARDVDVFSGYLSKLQTTMRQLNDLTSQALDFSKTNEFDVGPEPWKTKAQQLKAQKKIPVDAEEELRNLKEGYSESRRTIAQRDEHISTIGLKIETLESRMRDAQTNIERIGTLEADIASAAQEVISLKEEMEKQDRELKDLEGDRDKWKTIASESQIHADNLDDSGANSGQERAVATAREMDTLKRDIESLQAAVRYLREDNRRARLTEQHNQDWLAEPLMKQPTIVEQRKRLVTTEGKDVLGELLKMTTSAAIFDYNILPEDKLAWKPARQTPQYHAAKLAEDYATWRDWQDSVVKKSRMIKNMDGLSRGRRMRDPAASLQRRLPTTDGKAQAVASDEVRVVGSGEWEARSESEVSP